MARHTLKRWSILFSFLIAFPCILSAANVRWQWNDIDAAYYRWQLDGESEDGWTVVDGNTLYADTYDLDPTLLYNFHIQSSPDGVSWSNASVETWGGFDEIATEEVDAAVDVSESMEDAPAAKSRRNRFGVRAGLSPYSFVLYDFYKGHDIKDAKYLTMTNYSAALDTELFWKTPWPLALHLDAGYTLALKNETVIPNAVDVHYVRLGGGLDCVIANEKLSFAFGVHGGELITFNADHWNPGSYLGGRLLLEFKISDNLLFGCQSRVTVSHQKASDPLMSSLTWIVDPMALSVSYMF